MTLSHNAASLMCSSLKAAIAKEIETSNRAEWQRSLNAWNAHLDQAPPRTHRRLAKGFLADVELQPLRWLRAGAEIIETPTVVSRAKNLDGSDGVILQAILPYWAFAAGVELFLKGMLLCRYKPCRALSQSDYMDQPSCQYFEGKIKRYGHDLMALIRANKRVARYRRDAIVRRFLKRLSALIRLHYYPLFAMSRVAWANSRYPKRFFNDSAGVAKADVWVSLPDQRLVGSLFKGMVPHLDNLWGITRGLLSLKKLSRQRGKDK